MRSWRRLRAGLRGSGLYAAASNMEADIILASGQGTPFMQEVARMFPSKGNWSNEQLKLAFHLYCQTPFGKLHSRNPQIIELARLIGRTPGALAMKLVNFASLDPSITDSGRRGLRGASALDRQVWNEFHADWGRLAVECEQLRAALSEAKDEVATRQAIDEDDFALDDYSGSTRHTVVQQRIKQAFFRRTVLASYRGRCCVSGVSDARLLVASHIVPWRQDKANRLNPSNGLCLSALHDKAFDQHLFSLTDDHRIVLSADLRASKDTFLREVFWPAEDRQIELPDRFRPGVNFISSHRETMLKTPARHANF